MVASSSCWGSPSMLCQETNYFWRLEEMIEIKSWD